MQKLFLFVTFLAGIFSPAWSQPCLPNPNSLDFNGTTSFIMINTLTGLEITNQLTVEAWIYPTQFAASTTGNSIFCKHAWSSSMYGYVLRCGGSGELSLNIGGAIGGSPVGWQEVISPAGALFLNTWQHVAGVFDGTSMNLYINGQPAGSFSFAGTINPSTGYKARIGALSDTVWGMSRYFTGMIDEVRVWDRALSQAELQGGMNDHLDPAIQTGLVGYWRLNEGSGSAINDLGSGNNSGTAVNTTWTNQVPFNNLPPPTPTITYSAGQLHSSATADNQWYFEGTLIPGATQQTYIPVNYGNYTVKVTDNTSGCSALSDPFYYNTTGLPTTQNLAGILFQSPVHSTLTVSLLSCPDKLNFEIFSVTGSVLKKGELQPSSVNNININDLQSGVYFITCCNAGAKVCRRFVVH